MPPRINQTNAERLGSVRQIFFRMMSIKRNKAVIRKTKLRGFGKARGLSAASKDGSKAIEIGLKNTIKRIARESR